MKQKKLVKGTLLILAIAAAIALLAVLPSVHSADEAEMAACSVTKAEICYESYEVQQNDTLWKIAEQYAASYGSSVDAYVKLLRDINHLSGDRIITGQRLIVLYRSY